jgi:hypothetical protein
LAHWEQLSLTCNKRLCKVIHPIQKIAANYFRHALRYPRWVASPVEAGPVPSKLGARHVAGVQRRRCALGAGVSCAPCQWDSDHSLGALGPRAIALGWHSRPRPPHRLACWRRPARVIPASRYVVISPRKAHVFTKICVREGAFAFPAAAFTV